MYHPVGQKFARNRSISYGFRDTFSYWPPKQFFIFRKNPRWPPKVAIIEISLLCTGDSCTTLWVKNLLENRSISYGFRDIDIFHFPQKSKMAPKVAKIEIFPLWTGDSCTTLWVKNSLEIALSLTVFEVLTLFHFLRKSKMAAESGEN